MKQSPHSRMELAEKLLHILPPIIPRHKCRNHLGDLYSAQYMANLDSAGLGPRSIKLGRKVVYLREDLIAWLLERLEGDREAQGDA